MNESERALALSLLLVLVGACSTIGSTGQGDVDLPSSGVGPFRKLGQTEVPGVDPFVLDDETLHLREPSALALDDDSASTRVALYAVAKSGAADVIVRSRADDARAFFGTSADAPAHKPVVVLRADAAWEGNGIAGPSALRVGAEIWLYYAAAGGIGLARSTDGLTFTKSAAPVFADASGEVHAPSVARFPDGTFHMMYAARGLLWEATSADGVAWSKGDAPVLGPSAAPAIADDSGAKPPFDTDAVDDPLLLPRTTPAGRLQVRVLYTGYVGAAGDRARASTIGFAARYGESGALVRQAQPVYSVGKHEASPALFAWSGGALLYVSQDKTTGGAMATVVPAIAAAIAPATATLPPPLAFPDSP